MIVQEPSHRDEKSFVPRGWPTKTTISEPTTAWQDHKGRIPSEMCFFNFRAESQSSAIIFLSSSVDDFNFFFGFFFFRVFSPHRFCLFCRVFYYRPAHECREWLHVTEPFSSLPRNLIFFLVPDTLPSTEVSAMLADGASGTESNPPLMCQDGVAL